MHSRQRKWRRWLGALALWLGAAGTSPGDIVLGIVNFDFETGGLADGAFSNNPGVIPSGWVAAPGGITPAFYGYFNPQNNTFPGTTGLPGVIGTMSGPNVFYFGSATTGQGIEQTLADTFAVDTDYALTVSVGIRSDYLFAAKLDLVLLAGTTVLAQQTVDIASPATAGTFSDSTLLYTANPAHHGLAGSLLTVRFLENDSGLGVGAHEMDIDNVRLTATAVPEPGAAALLAGGLALGAGLAARHRRKS